MGFRVRKSINLGGGFRVNISKSGIGYSWGTRGFRVTKTARGTTRTTASIPGTGVSYVTESKKNKRSTSPDNSNSYTPLPEKSVVNLENGDLNLATSDDYKDFVSSLQNIKDLNRFLNCALLVALFFAPYFELPLWILLVVKIWFRFFKKIHIDYQFDDDKNACANMELFKTLKKSDVIWRVIQEVSSSSLKNDFGINTSAEIEPIEQYGSLPFYLRSNIQPVIFQHKKEKFIFFPEKLLIENKTEITAIAYEDMSIDFGYIRFLYKGKVPSDAQVVDSQYMHVNKDGSPDKRYKENPQYPICLFGKANFSFGNDVHIHLMCSNPNVIDELKKLSIN